MKESPVALSFQTTPPTAVSADTQCISGKSRAEPLDPLGNRLVYVPARQRLGLTGLLG